MKNEFSFLSVVCSVLGLAWVVDLAAFAQGAGAQPSVIYSTGFEVAERYDTNLTLVGQNGWVASISSGGNGLLTSFFEGYGQQAFIGFSPPDGTNDTLNIWRPINYVPSGTNATLVKFSVLMSIADSTDGQFDDFRWSVYNISGTRLFTLDFDNATFLVSYALDDTKGFVSTGTTFTNGSLYALVITMDFKRNLWSATVNNLSVVNAKPITATNSVLNLGDIDAVWAIHRRGSPGDNYMLFDNYEVTAETVPSIPPTLETVTRLANGQFLLRIFGEPGISYAVEASTNLVDWTPRTTLSASDGVMDYLDTNAPAASQSFYRAHSVR
ncbi:MAG: hypothetical protein ACYDH9_04695 [Limisphaerales bacterium]